MQGGDLVPFVEIENRKFEKHSPRWSALQQWSVSKVVATAERVYPASRIQAITILKQ